jgi:hypothetical protein
MRVATFLASFVFGGIFLVGCDFDPVGPRPSEPMTLVAGDSASGIYAVDEVTGTATLLKSAVWQFQSFGLFPVGTITSMSWIPSEDSWWITGGRRGFCPNCIYAFDPAADSARLVRHSIFEVDVLADFAVDPLTDRVYTLKRDEAGYLFRVDLSTGAFLEVMRRLDEGPFGKGATFGSDGLLYVAGGDKLTRIRLSRMEDTIVGTLSYVGFPTFVNYSVAIAALATRADGVVLALVQDGGGPAGAVTTTFLAAVDLETAVVTHLTATSTPLSALAYVPTRLVY